MATVRGSARPAFVLLASVFLAALGPGSLLAAEPGMFEVGAFGGWDGKSPRNELGNANGEYLTEIPRPGAGGGLRASMSVWGPIDVEVDARYVMSKLQDSRAAAPIVGLRALAVYNVTLGRLWTPFARVGLGPDILMTKSTTVESPNDADLGFQAGVGVRRELIERLGVRLDLTVQVASGRNETYVPEFEGWLGVYWLFGTAPDSDGDGLRDRHDDCAALAEDKDGFEDADGCPEADNDGDGFADAVDKCPLAAEVSNGVADDDGCPDADGDGDGDGFEDASDKCPAQAETKNGFEDQDGCPDDPDSDGDGIGDSKDKCPKVAETKNAFEDDDGCADVLPDGDADGVPDRSDKCPKEKETANFYQDDDGCPDTLPEKLKKYTGTMHGIEFDSGKATIAEKSAKFLTGVVAILTEYKDTKVEVSGHTDDRGDPAVNLKLSQDRADAVKVWLVGKSIVAERIATVGYGHTRPIAPNDKDKGRARNRRIEFRLF